MPLLEDGQRRPSRRSGHTRRQLLAAAAGVVAMARHLRAEAPVLFGLTPVFLDSDVELLRTLETWLGWRIGRAVTLVKRRTYQEITALLLSGQLDAAWICGFPLVQYPRDLAVVAVPLWQGQPLYRSYLIAGAQDQVTSLSGMRGYVHAFSDPDSNSGFLVTRHLLAKMRERPETFFSRFFFTYGHRNVIRAVSAGLAGSGSVDGYVWEVVRAIDPQLTAGTRVVRQSELLGFPPVACNVRRRDTPVVKAIGDALVSMHEDPRGRALLATLRLDGFVHGDFGLFEGIAQKYREVQAQA